MTKARENSDYTGLQGDLAGLQTNITAGDTAARAGRKNLIINGDNRISQRGTYTSALDFVHNQYHFDRWKSNKAGGSIDGTIVQSSATIDGAICITQLYTVTTGSASSYIGAHQRLEFPETFIGRTVTISAWVKSNTTTARLQIYNQASGGNATIAVDTHTGGGAWEYLTATGTVLAGTTALSLFVATLTEAAGTVTTVTGDYIAFTNVQLELGSVATDFEHRSYGEELALCLRYFYKPAPLDFSAQGSHWSGNNGYMTFHFPVPMRAKPSYADSGSGTYKTYYNGIQRVNGGQLGDGGGTHTEIILLNSNSNSPSTFVRLDGSDKFCSFDAEL